MSNKNFESTKYNSLVRKVVRDVTKVIKSGSSGLFILPEHFSDEITYRYSGLGTEFEVTVVVFKDNTVTDFELCGGYYSDDNEIELVEKIAVCTKELQTAYPSLLSKLKDLTTIKRKNVSEEYISKEIIFHSKLEKNVNFQVKK
jgi:hypothetical protein